MLYRRQISHKQVTLFIGLFFLLSLFVTTAAKPRRAQEEGLVRTEFRFGPAPLPHFVPKEGDPKLEERPGNISVGNGKSPAVIQAHVEGLEVNDVIKLLGDAYLESGEATISFQVDGVTRARAGLNTTSRNAQIKFAATLPKGEGDIVIELGPNSTLTITQLRMEKLL